MLDRMAYLSLHDTANHWLIDRGDGTGLPSVYQASLLIAAADGPSRAFH